MSYHLFTIAAICDNLNLKFICQYQEPDGFLCPSFKIVYDNKGQPFEVDSLITKPKHLLSFIKYME